LLLVDGLGSELLRANREVAPFLNSLAKEPMTAGFPATTVASISSIATGSVMPASSSDVGIPAPRTSWASLSIAACITEACRAAP